MVKQRQVEAVAVEGYQLRAELIDAVDDGLDQLGLRPFIDTRGTDRRHPPSLGLPTGNQGADADDPVERMLREFRAEGLPNHVFRLSLQPIAPRNRREVGHGLKVPNEDRGFGHRAIPT